MAKAVGDLASGELPESAHLPQQSRALLSRSWRLDHHACSSQVMVHGRAHASSSQVGPMHVGAPPDPSGEPSPPSSVLPPPLAVSGSDTSSSGKEAGAEPHAGAHHQSTHSERQGSSGGSGGSNPATDSSGHGSAAAAAAISASGWATEPPIQPDQVPTVAFVHAEGTALRTAASELRRRRAAHE